MNSSEGAVWCRHVVTDGGESSGEEEEEDEGGGVSGPQQRGRFQHVGFNRKAPPGAGNTKPCDYPKHTGSAWVSEPAPFPSLKLWTVWDTCPRRHSAPSAAGLFPSGAQNRWPLITLRWPVLIFIAAIDPERRRIASPGSWTHNNKQLGLKKTLWFSV